MKKEESEGSKTPEYSVKAMNILHVGLLLEWPVHFHGMYKSETLKTE